MTLLFGIGGFELFFVIAAVLLLFGAKGIPELARGLGKGMNEFKKATDEIKREFDDHRESIGKEVKDFKDDISKMDSNKE